jgi:hypothetical protein
MFTRFTTTTTIIIIVVVVVVVVVSRGNVAGIETGYGLDDRWFGVRVPAVSRLLNSPYRQDRHWGPPNLLPNGYRGLFPKE